MEIRNKKVAVIGAGISGLTCGQILAPTNEVKIFEKESSPGGLIRCKHVNGSLFHLCGGHVFNSKRDDVLNWFWSKFKKEKDFSKTDRNSVVFMEGGAQIPYPVENHVYLMGIEVQKKFIDDLVRIARNTKNEPRNFEEFLKERFGNTLYDIYFQPYNEKVWRRDLKQVPLSWLEGKLPMPTVEEMIFNNINHVKEKSFVHATFWYERNNGSQYIADILSKGLNIVYNVNIENIVFSEGKWIVQGEKFDNVIFCGNIKDMIHIIKGININEYKDEINKLEYHGTTAVFSEIDKNPYSWIYQPSRLHESHRIICTGNFSASNNDPSLSENRITATIEFTDEISKDAIIDNLKKIPLNPVYLDHKFNKYTYPIQDNNTRMLIRQLKAFLAPYNFLFTGRFADWEYYNMDMAIGAALDTLK